MDKVFTVFVSFHAKDWDDAEDFVYTMTEKIGRAHV